tara:strand:+ start:136 stop:270 length:135 start_codon:yes stop_codon:yes gene_type:complete
LSVGTGLTAYSFRNQLVRIEPVVIFLGVGLVSFRLGCPRVSLDS